MAEPIGSLVVRIGGDTTDLLNSFRRAGKATEDFNARVQQTVTAVKALASAFVIREAAQFVGSLAAAGDEAARTAERFGLTTEALSELRFAADISRVGVQTFDMALQRFSRRTAEAAQGGGEAKDALKQLGIEVLDANGRLKASDVLLAEVADAFQGVSDANERTRLAFKLFDSEGVKLLNMLDRGSAGLAQMRKEAQALGVVWSTEDAAAAQEFTEHVTRLEAAAKGLSIQIGGPLIEALGKAAKAMLDAKAAGESFFGSLSEGLFTLFTGTDAFKIDKQITETTNRLLEAQNALDAAKANVAMFGSNTFDDAAVKRWTEEVRKAQAELDLLLQKKALLAPPETQQKGAERPQPGAPLPPTSESSGEAERLARQIQEGVEEEQRKQAEAIAAIVAARHKQLAEEQRIQDERLQAIFEAYEREQEAAIEQGEILLEHDSLSHSTKLQRLFEAHDAEFAENERFRLAVQELEENFTEEELEALGGLHQVKEELEQEHQQRLLQIRMRALTTAAQFTKASYAQQTKTIFSELAAVTAGVSQHNRQLFEINKVAGIAMAIVNAYEGISLTLSKYPYPLNIAMAAAHAAAAFAQVSAIQSASFGGGGGGTAPSIAGSTPATPVTPVAASQSGGGQTTVIQLHGETFGRKQLRALFDEINEMKRDGGRIIVQ